MDKPSGNSFNIFGFPIVLFTYTPYNFGTPWAQSDQGKLCFGDESMILKPWWFSECILQCLSITKQQKVPKRKIPKQPNACAVGLLQVWAIFSQGL